VRTRVGRELARAGEDRASYAGPAAQTVVLVLGESVNRSNWSLYGYPRRTTPELERRRAQLLVFRNVQSADAATAQSLLKMLTPATAGAPEAWRDQPNVLALARRAGYKVFWLSNQERADGPIQILAEHAHEQVFVNSGRGREARSLDERMLVPLERILARPEPRKLVVVHMQGAHLRYNLRYPQAYDRFSDADDGVDAALRAAGRPFWIRKARDEYDNAMLYGDHVLSAILDRVQAGTGRLRCYMCPTTARKSATTAISPAIPRSTRAATRCRCWSGPTAPTRPRAWTAARSRRACTAPMCSTIPCTACSTSARAATAPRTICSAKASAGRGRK
jgi:heptose-I-phosphate ethanolaminephosphotransferase